jgi:hypothetical protein
VPFQVWSVSVNIARWHTFTVIPASGIVVRRAEFQRGAKKITANHLFSDSPFDIPTTNEHHQQK